METPDFSLIPRHDSLGDKVFNHRHIKGNVWLLEMHRGPRSRQTWHLAFDFDRLVEVGRVSRPSYGFRRLRFDNKTYARNLPYAGHIEGHLEMPQGGHELLTQMLVDWVEKFY